jgi:DNA polymerase
LRVIIAYAAAAWIMQRKDIGAWTMTSEPRIPGVRQPSSPPIFAEHPPGTSGLTSLRHQAEACERCDLYRNATQVVFGEGPAKARVVLVGEQPGDREDIAGRPFVGPAGSLLDECLDEAAVDRSSATSPMR